MALRLIPIVTACNDPAGTVWSGESTVGETVPSATQRLGAMTAIRRLHVGADRRLTGSFGPFEAIGADRSSVQPTGESLAPAAAQALPPSAACRRGSLNDIRRE